MKKLVLPAATGLVVGIAGFWLLGGLVKGPDHDPGAGKFEEWTGPKFKFLHIYLSSDDECPPNIAVFPNEDAAEIWRDHHPKKIMWKVQGGGDQDEWTIDTKTGPDHFPDAKKIKREDGEDAFWSKLPKPAGQNPQTDWRWDYDVTLKRAGCEDSKLDPPVHIRK